MGTFTLHRDFLEMGRDVWIESGTCLGASIDAALAYGYREIRSCDTSKTLYSEACSKYSCNDKVFLSNKTSPDAFADWLPLYSHNHVTFWLDGHYDGVQPKDEAYGECPLFNEFAEINKVKWQRKPLIMIDDAEMFFPQYWGAGTTAHLFDPNQWPTYGELIDRMPRGYNSRVLDGTIYFWSE
jgi:hypothetical protein